MQIAKRTPLALACALMMFLNASASFPGPVPDTGQTKCYDNTGEIPCPQPNDPFYGQDGNYLINPPSYTKLGHGGVELDDSATPADGWLMTRDTQRLVCLQLP